MSKSHLKDTETCVTGIVPGSHMQERKNSTPGEVDPDINRLGSVIPVYGYVDG